MTASFRGFLLVVAATLVALVAQLETLSGSYTPDGYVPWGNDAFYHARRILDAVEDPDAFYQFDTRIHAPEGSLILWPWGYDYLMAALVRGGLAIGMHQDPMTILAYVPVAAVAFAMLLLFSISRSLNLSAIPTLLMMLCFALLPLTGSLHGVGRVDHHWAEFLAILAFVAGSLAWSANPASRLRAALLGLALGLAPAFHTGLFVLQAVLLVFLGLTWLRGTQWPLSSLVTFAAALVASTVAVLLPSLPFQQGIFEYFLLSWFHLYVAVVTAVLAVIMGRLSPSWSGVLALGLLALVLGVPTVGTVLDLGSFASKENAALQDISEARSIGSWSEEVGVYAVLSAYSGFLVLAPVIWLASLFGLFGTRDRRWIFLCVYAVVFLPLLYVQLRFHYYGTLALFVPALVGLDWVLNRFDKLAVKVAAVALTGLAIYPSAVETFGARTPLGGDSYYLFTAAAMPDLASACAENPGIVLARNNDGHLIRFRTDCSVIANNFLLTQQQFQAYDRVVELFDLTTEELLAAEPQVDYVFVRARSALVETAKGVELADREFASMAASRLEQQLLWGDPTDLPASFELISEVAGPLDYPLSRIYRINRNATRSPAS